MQNRFGDAGHGWHLMSPPNTSYLHREVKFRHNGEWDSCFIIMRCKNDGRYGLGGLTSWSNGGAPGVSFIGTWAPTVDEGSPAATV